MKFFEDSKYVSFVVNPKTARGRGGQFDPPPPCGFSKNVYSKERVKP